MNSPAGLGQGTRAGAPKTVLGREHAGADCVSEGCETLGWMIRPRGRALGADRLDRRGTRPGDPTLVASPRRVALHAAQRRRPRSVATSTLMSGEAAVSASWKRSTLDTRGSLSPVLSPRTCLPYALPSGEPAVGAGLPAQDGPVGMTHCMCKAKLPSCSLGRSSAPSPATRAGYACPARLTHSTSGPCAAGGTSYPHHGTSRSLLGR